MDGDYVAKQKLQYLVFPEGIYYNKKKDECRTTKVNSIFSLFSSISVDYTENKDKVGRKFFKKSGLVPSAGIEPVSMV